MPGRRTLLLAGGAGVLALAGCGSTGGASADVTRAVIGQGAAPSPSSSVPAPPRAWASVAHDLQQTAALFAGAASAKGATHPFSTWAKAVSTLCAVQSATLATGDPLTVARPPAPVRVQPASQASMAAAVTAIRNRQNQQATALANLAVSASAGDQAALLASLATFAHATATQKAVPVSAAKTPAHLDPGSRADALQALLSHVAEAVQGYEMGAGALPANSPGVQQGRDRVTSLWQMRDDVQQQVLAASASPDAASLDYHMPGGFGSLATTRHTWGLLEQDLLGGWLHVAAASSGADRRSAVQQMFSQADAVQALGVGMTTWPGWA